MKLCLWLFPVSLLFTAACQDSDPAPGGWTDGLTDARPADMTPDGLFDLPPPDTRKPKCGDGFIDAGEKCDGKNLDSKTCKLLGFYTGTLGCTGKCIWDTAACTDCGNGKIDPGEQCDKSDLSGKTCKGFGYFKGTLKCNTKCVFDLKGCSNCGNGVVDKNEQCDGKNLAGKTCKLLGFGTGVLKCGATCFYDISGCK